MKILKEATSGYEMHKSYLCVLNFLYFTFLRSSIFILNCDTHRQGTLSSLKLISTPSKFED